MGRRAALTLLVCLAILFASRMHGQDGSTGTLRVTVADATGAMVPNANVTVVNTSTAVTRTLPNAGEGLFVAAMLTPAEYQVTVEAPGMSREVRSAVVEVGGETELRVVLKVGPARETVDVPDQPLQVELQSGTVSAVLTEKEISDLPLNGRRFQDLAQMAPGVSTDPRGLTSSSTGDLAFGGVRGYHSSFVVDGADNNNSFFAQARGRYRAPYQFSNEVVQEFRVSSNTYGVELGRSGGAVVNVVTKSGGNHTHGTAFWYLRDARFNARHAYTPFKPKDRQHQFGGTLSGPIRKNRAFWFAGFDQHVFSVPNVVRFVNGASAVVPGAGDYEPHDQALVFAAAERLTGMAGTFRSELLGNSGLAKMDWTVTPQHHLTARLSTSRYWGKNNVFFDPASPVTTFAISENGEERVRTESGTASLTSAVSVRVTNRFRLQLSRDLQKTSSNSADVRTKIADIVDGFGRSSILPRETRELKIHAADTLSHEGRTHKWKFGFDVAQTWIRNYFPLMFGGQYIFDDIRVNQWTFAPQTYGMRISPLRAYAHNVPRYYIQEFGQATSHPDTAEYALFAQDALRVTGRLALTLGLRYDLQTFRAKDIESHPLWPQSGKMPHDRNNVAPRVGFAYSVGDGYPFVIRGGYGVFYTRIPQIYNSAVETDNGVSRSHLFLDNSDFYDRGLFPVYPAPLANCPPGAETCAAPANLSSRLTTEVSSFAHDFRVPYVQQASLSVERELTRRLSAGVSYMYTHGTHLIRARDVNLPRPVVTSYPVFSEDGTTFTGHYYDVASFTPWVMTTTLGCPYPPCLAPLERPISQLGAINVFESAASSVYHGLTVSLRKRMANGLYFRAAYTWARSMDDGQDALVVGRPATVQNSYSTNSERGASVTDQRHRFLVSWIAEPRPFHRDHPILKSIFNDWKLSGVMSFGSGRPVDARIIGDSNMDGNTSNDRLPGVRRNAYTGPNYATTDTRLTRKLRLSEKWRLELSAESFNLFNRVNRKVEVNDDGFTGAAGTFVRTDKNVGAAHYPAHYRIRKGFLVPTNAYAPRQVQFAARIVF